MARRSQKATARQFEELINFVESYKDVLCSNSSNTRHTNKYTKLRLWQTFANDVNAKRLGPPKTGGQWRKVFNEWKVNTKRKMKGSNENTVLSDLQQRLLTLISEKYSSVGDYTEEYKTDYTDAQGNSPSQQNATVEKDVSSQQIELPVIKQEQPELDVLDPIDYEEDNTTTAIPTEQTDHIYTTKSTSAAQNSFDMGSLTAEAVNNLASAINNLADAKKKEAEALHLLAKAKLLSAKAKYYEVCNKKSLDDLDI